MAKKQILAEGFPKQDEFVEKALLEEYDFILYGGAIKGGKTVALLLAAMFLCLRYPGARAVFVRKDRKTIERNSLPTWNKIKPTSLIQNENLKLLEYTFNNGSSLMFFEESYNTDKELNRWRGLDANWFFIDEINEIQEESYKKAVERCGTWVIPNLKKQPKPQIFATCNPTYGWVKKKWYLPWKNSTLPENQLYIPSRIYDNPHISKHQIEYYKRELPEYQRLVYVEGMWDVPLKTGGEFFEQFNPDIHVGKVEYDPTEIVHVSVDSNVFPYIAVSIWQIIEQEDFICLNQISEIVCKDPDNTARASGNKVVSYLESINYDDVVYVYGDQTTMSRNTIDDNKKSFFDKFTDIIDSCYVVSRRMPSSNPSVVITGEFVNAIYEKNYGWLKIMINEECTESIQDYIVTKKDEKGKMLKLRTTDPKTQISYEPNGHFSDVKRYFISQACKRELNRFKRRFSSREVKQTMGGYVADNNF